jgi:ankyrin repeat protein
MYRPSLIGKRVFNRFRGFICGGNTKVVIDESKIETTEPKVVIEEPVDDEIFNVIDNYCELLNSIDNYCERSLKLYLNKNNINRKNKHYYNYTPLIYACYKNITVFIEIILAAGADINITENGFNAFLYACKNGNLKIVKRLVELGANINQKTNKNNCTVLMAVCNLGYTDIVKFLLEYKFLVRILLAI